MRSDRITQMPVKLSSLHIPEKPPGLLDKYSWVYILCSSSRRALYVGVTNNLRGRVFQHKNNMVDGFTKKYKCHRLVYYESFPYIGEAIAREKELKGWRREKKNALIETMNPKWIDLSEGWYEMRGFPAKDESRVHCADYHGHERSPRALVIIMMRVHRTPIIYPSS